MSIICIEMNAVDTMVISIKKILVYKVTISFRDTQQTITSKWIQVFYYIFYRMLVCIVVCLRGSTIIGVYECEIDWYLLSSILLIDQNILLSRSPLNTACLN
ncbi:hypothetical protein BDC45DRAFT_530756 [Circinella umbellata]|nr:hypothetical protein BDC45DRAFT_530756 [Circinella umbellata]